jgi:hypothetical protein
VRVKEGLFAIGVFVTFCLTPLGSVRAEEALDLSSYPNVSERKTKKATSTMELIHRQRPLTSEDILLLYRAAKKIRENGDPEFAHKLEGVIGKLTNV